MKTLIWKFLFARALDRQVRIGFWMAWESAGAWLECFEDALDDDPVECADEEVEEWRACS